MIIACQVGTVHKYLTGTLTGKLNLFIINYERNHNRVQSYTRQQRKNRSSVRTCNICACIVHVFIIRVPYCKICDCFTMRLVDNFGIYPLTLYNYVTVYDTRSCTVSSAVSGVVTCSNCLCFLVLVLERDFTNLHLNWKKRTRWRIY